MPPVVLDNYLQVRVAAVSEDPVLMMLCNYNVGFALLSEFAAHDCKWM
jgi:hypothetical protein